jgi:hypothetical protein
MWRDVLDRLDRHFRAPMGGHPPARVQDFAPSGVSIAPPASGDQELQARAQIPDTRVAQHLARSAVRILEPETVAVPVAPERATADDEPGDAGDPTSSTRGGSDPDGGGDGASARPIVHRPRVLGVNISEGTAYLAVVEVSGTPRLELADRVVAERDLDDADRLARFAGDIGRVLASTQIGVVAVARPERYTGWSYTEAFDRISLETCIVLAAQARGMRYESVGQNHAANVIGLPLDRVNQLLSSRLGIPKTKAWSDRWPALLVALATREARAA